MSNATYVGLFRSTAKPVGDKHSNGCSNAARPLRVISTTLRLLAFGGEGGRRGDAFPHVASHCVCLATFHDGWRYLTAVRTSSTILSQSSKHKKNPAMSLYLSFSAHVQAQAPLLHDWSPPHAQIKYIYLHKATPILYSLTRLQIPSTIRVDFL